MYEQVGSYAGDLGALPALDSFEVSWSPDGYGTTTDRLGLIRDAYLPKLGACVPGEWACSMLVALRPNGFVPLHKDSRDEALQRYHVVLSTNPHCWNYHDGGIQHLEAGGVYSVDETKEHASINWGEETRVHLVVDAVGV